MSRRADGQLFVGRLSKNTRVRDLEDVFEPYGRLVRCDIKYGAEMAYAFVDFEDRRDGEDAVRYENGREICGSSIIVEWAKGNPRRPPQGYDECYKCHRAGHWARDCLDDRYNMSNRRTGGRTSRYSRSPRRRKSYRSRSRSRSRRRSRSRSRDRRKRTRSHSGERRHKRKRHSRSQSKEKKAKSQSRSRSPGKSPSKSKSRSRSKSPSVDKTNGEQDNDHDRSGGNSAASSPAQDRSRSASPK